MQPQSEKDEDAALHEAVEKAVKERQKKYSEDEGGPVKSISALFGLLQRFGRRVKNDKVS